MAPTTDMNAIVHKAEVRSRNNLRLAPELWGAIDEARIRRPGSVSRNTWIAEAILEKLAREALERLPEGRNDV